MQKNTNEFIREHLNIHQKTNLNTIKHDSNTTKEHRSLVNEICNWATENKLDFLTRAVLKEGKIVDVVIPSLIRPFIEVRDSEEKKHKEYLDKYKELIQFIDVSDPFKLS
jgi:hypothetical protein